MVRKPLHTMEQGGEINHEETYKKWKSLVNMSKSELENFVNDIYRKSIYLDMWLGQDFSRIFY
jgi:hypothetical protein